MNHGYSRIQKLYKGLVKGNLKDDSYLDLLLEYVFLEFAIYHENYESLMDEKTGMSFHQYIS